jgi:thiol:disulfide interchange protein DsbD
MRLAFLFAAVIALSAAENPLAWSIAGAPPKAGQTATIRLNATVEPGWYLYGFTQPEDGPRPTRIWLPEGQPFTLKGAIKAPAAKRAYDENFNMEVEKFHGNVSFRIPVQSTGSGPLGVSVQYQTCSDTLCLPPRTVTVKALSPAPAGH